MSRCETCRFWRPLDAEGDDHYWAFPLDDVGPDVPAPYAPRCWGTCLREDEPNSPMFTNDASLYFARLRTLDTFSCSAWEAKE